MADEEPSTLSTINTVNQRNHCHCSALSRPLAQCRLSSDAAHSDGRADQSMLLSADIATPATLFWNHQHVISATSPVPTEQLFLTGRLAMVSRLCARPCADPAMVCTRWSSKIGSSGSAGQPPSPVPSRPTAAIPMENSYCSWSWPTAARWRKLLQL